MECRTLMRRAARFHADRPAIIHGDATLTFAEAWERGLRLANALISLGLKPGDRIGILEDNSIEASDTFLAATIANLVRVPLYPRNSREAHLHMLGHTGCRVLLVSETHAEAAEGLERDLPDLERVLVRDGAFVAWQKNFPADDPQAPVDRDDNFIIRHTGGTTGLPKGVAYTHRAWLAAGRDWFYLFPPVMPGDRCLHAGPISHGSGYFFVPIWLAGGCNVLLDHFEPGAALETMAREEIGYGFLVPTMLNLMTQHPLSRSLEFPKLKCLQVGAAPITEATIRASREVFGDRLWQGYGQTEAVPITMMGPDQWFAEMDGSEPLRSCGQPLPFADLEIWDEDNNALPIGETGEIVVRCDGQMSAFWNDPESTKERLVNGWVKTGDIGMIDRNGYVYMHDRAGDMIISGGFNIYPAELENVLCSHPDVLEAAVFGIPSERWGETPMAVCTVVPGAQVTEAELVALCAERLGSYKRPAGVSLTEEPLPKSPVGKLLRKDLREPYWAGHDRRVAGN